MLYKPSGAATATMDVEGRNAMSRINEGFWIRRLKSIAIGLGAFTAVTAAAMPTWADKLRNGDTCTAKIFVDSVHLCGTSPGTGTLKFTNVGIHLVGVFTIAAGTDTSGWDGSANGATKFTSHYIDSIPSNTSATIPVNQYDQVWIARADHTISYRTISVRFDDIPGSVPIGASLPGEQRIEALVDALTCPQSGLAGSLSVLGITVELTPTTAFSVESCRELAALFASGTSLRLDVEIVEAGTGMLSATEVELAEAPCGACRSGKHRGKNTDR
jgi:hypothetical protein